MKLRGPLRRAFLALALVSAPAPGIGASESVSPEELFKWGEYDSLIQVLEPGRPADRDGTVGLATRADSTEEARARLYLGVAYWAKGRTEAGSRAFLQATRLDPDLRLDPLYATPEMAAHFERLAEVSQKQPPPAPPAPARAGGPPETRKSRDASTWWKWGGATGLAVAGTLAVLYFTARPPSPRVETTVIDPDIRDSLPRVSP